MSDSGDDPAWVTEKPTPEQIEEARRLYEQYKNAETDAERVDAIVHMSRLDRRINRETYEALEHE